MAARRLLIVMLILLGISTLAAALAPPRPPGSRTETTETKAAAPPLSEPTEQGRLLKATIDADAGRIGVVPLRAGDELALSVKAKQADQIEIPGLGQIAAVSRDAPASFDLLLDEAGSYNVRLVDAGRVVGRLEVSPAAPQGVAPPK